MFPPCDDLGLVNVYNYPYPLDTKRFYACNEGCIQQRSILYILSRRLRSDSNAVENGIIAKWNNSLFLM